MNVAIYILLACFWGCSFIAIKYVLEVIPPFFSAFLRTFLSVFFLVTYMWLTQKKRPDFGPRTILKWTVLGVFAFAIPWAALFWGEQFIQPSLAGMINSSVPIFALCLSWVMIPKETLSKLSAFGVMLGFVGIGLIFMPNIRPGVMSDMSFWGMIAIIIMAFSYAVNAVGTKKYGRQIDLTWALLIQSLTSSVLLFGLSMIRGETLPSLYEVWQHPKAFWGILYLAFCSTTLAMMMFYRLVYEWGPVKASSVNYILPFVAILVDYVALNKLPSVFEWAGVLTIVTGLLMLHYYRSQKTQSVDKTPLTARST